MRAGTRIGGESLVVCPAMDSSTRIRTLAAAIKGLAVLADPTWLTAGAVLASELAPHLDSLSRDQRSAISSATNEEWKEAISTAKITSENTAMTLACVLRLESELAALKAAIATDWDGRIEGLTRKCESVQKELERVTFQAGHLAGGVRFATHMADSAAELSPLTRSLIEALRASLSEFDANVDVDVLGPERQRRYRIAKGTLANAERRFDEALSLVPEEDIEAAQAAVESQTESLVDACRVRGDALYGQCRWADALCCYERIGRIRHDPLVVANPMGNTLLRLGRIEEALSQYTLLVDHATRLVEEEGRTDLAKDLAACLNNRGLARSNLGRLEPAIDDYDKAVEIRTRLVEEEGRTDLANDLAASLNNRGIARRALGRFEPAIDDFDKAVEIYTHLVANEGRSDLVDTLENVRANRVLAQSKP